MFSYLAQHPQIRPSFVKEVHYFDGGLNPQKDNYKIGPGWYRAHVPLQASLSPDDLTYEASPLYIYHPLVPARMYDLLPDAMLIALLRNPTERAISHYFHSVRKKKESLPILEALMEEDRRLAPIFETRDYKNEIFRRYSYKRRGLYKAQLERFLQFYPASQLFVIGSETFFANPEISVSKVADFLGVTPDFQVANFRPRNVASNRSQVGPEVYDYLNSYFQQHNHELYELLGENFGW